TFSITQGGATEQSWSWQEFRAVPSEDVTADIHCVTRWSKFDTRWRGVSVDTLLDQAGQDAPYVLAFCDGGDTTNPPIEDVPRGKGWGALDYDGEPLGPRRGRPGPGRGAPPDLSEGGQKGRGPGRCPPQPPGVLGSPRS